MSAHEAHYAANELHVNFPEFHLRSLSAIDMDQKYMHGQSYPPSFMGQLLPRHHCRVAEPTIIPNGVEQGPKLKPWTPALIYPIPGG